MSVTTKLLLLLTISVGIVMSVASLWILRQYERVLENALREDLSAHAITLKIALEEGLGDELPKERFADAQKLIDRLRTNTEIYGVLLFDKNKRLIAQSTILDEESLLHPPELHQALLENKTKNVIRKIQDKKFASSILPIQYNGETVGAVELVKPLSLLDKDIFQLRVTWFFLTLLLLAVICGVVYVVLRRNLSTPIKTLLSATQAVAEGDYTHEVVLKSRGDEFSMLADQFNQMARNLYEKEMTTKIETENRIKLEREIRHNEQLVRVGRMAAGVAHELGAPLNVIDARAEQLQKMSDIPEKKQIRNLEIIRSNVGRITHLVKLLLNLARPYNFSLEAVNLKESLALALEQIESAVEFAKVEVSFTGDDNIVVKADPNYLQQVWLNIMLNAVQEMPKGGRLSVGIKTDKEGFALTDISDTGKGILPEHFISLFDPFFTTKDVGKGTGLGLPIANRIVEDHGGTISAKNNLSGGAIFTVKLPLANLEENEK